MKVKFLNKNTILMNAKDNFAIVKWMMEHDYEHPFSNDVNVFMKSYAVRKELLENQKFRHDYVDQFVEDLISNKVIEILK